MLTHKELVEGFRALGVAEGDTLLVHSSFKSLGEVHGGPQTVIRALEETLGTDRDGGITATDLPLGIDRPADLPKLLDALRAMGWSERDLDAFAWRNWARFWGIDHAPTPSVPAPR